MFAPDFDIDHNKFAPDYEAASCIPAFLNFDRKYPNYMQDLWEPTQSTLTGSFCQMIVRE